MTNLFTAQSAGKAKVRVSLTPYLNELIEGSWRAPWGTNGCLRRSVACGSPSTFGGIGKRAQLNEEGRISGSPFLPIPGPIAMVLQQIQAMRAHSHPFWPLLLAQGILLLWYLLGHRHENEEVRKLTLPAIWPQPHPKP